MEVMLIARRLICRSFLGILKVSTAVPLRLFDVPAREPGLAMFF